MMMMMMNLFEVPPTLTVIGVTVFACLPCDMHTMSGAVIERGG
jgi:hypothetical protein